MRLWPINYITLACHFNQQTENSVGQLSATSLLMDKHETGHTFAHLIMQPLIPILLDLT